MPRDLVDTEREVNNKRCLFSYDNFDWVVWQQAIKHKATKGSAQSLVQTKMISTKAPIDKKIIWLLL